MRRWSEALLAGCSFFISILALSAAAAVPPAVTATAVAGNPLRVLGRPATTLQTGAPRANDRKLDGSLARMQSAYTAAKAAGTQASLDLHRSNPLARLRYSAPLAAPSVLVDAIVSGNPQTVKQQLEQLGFKSSAVFRNDIGGWLPVDQIAKAEAVTGLRFFKTAMPHTKATPPGPQATQGDFVQRSLALKQSSLYPGLTGAGITVGLISDSFDCASVANAQPGATHADDYADDVALGALPAGVNVIEEDPGCPAGTDEGRALAQIVYAVAPGAQLAFYTADGSEADFAQGILTLALPTNQTDPNGNSGGGAQIIDDDVGYEDEPVFQEGEVGLAIDQVAAQGVLYFSSAGNEGRDSYENAAPSFSGSAAAGAPNAGEQLLNMDTSGATQTYYLPFTIPPLAAGDGYDIALFWDQPYQSGYANDPGDVIGDPGVANGPGAASVVDICIGDTSGNIPTTGAIGGNSGDNVFNGPLETPTNCAGPSNVAPVASSGFTTTQPGENDPYNFIQVFNTGTSTTGAIQASLVVGLVSGPPPGRVKILIQDDGRGTQITQFVTASSTIQGHPLSPNAMAVGASFFYDTPACTSSLSAPVLEAFSSAGGSPFLFDGNGNPLNPPVTPQKPDIVAPDGVSTTFFGFPAQNEVEGSFSTPVPQCQLNPAFPFNFFGTSAAAPHAAGAAALMLQAAANAGVTVSNAQVYAALRQTATDMSSPGFDFDTGFGLVRADAAVAALLPAQLTLSAPSLSFATAGAQTETLTNSGTGPLTVGNVQATPSGITLSNGCPATVAAGASCSITLTAAGSVAANTGALSFATNAQGLGGSAAVPLSIPAQISVSPSSVSLLAQQGGSASQAVTVSNTGLGPLSISSVQVGPAAVSQANTCNAPLAAGASCTVTLTLATTSTGAALGSLVIGSNAGNAPGGTASVPVSATVNPNNSSGGAFTPWLLLPGLALSALRRRRRKIA